MFRRHPATGKRSLYNLKTGSAIEGVAVGQSGRYLKVQGATLHDLDSNQPVPMDGTVILDLDNIAYVQVTG